VETGSIDSQIPADSALTGYSEFDSAFERGLEGRRRKAAIALFLIWCITILLHLIPGGEIVILGLATLMGSHFLRLLMKRSPQNPPQLNPARLMSSREAIASEEPLPYISLLVAAKNEEAVITSLVNELCTLDYPSHRYELWVIDDHSTDQTPVLLERLSQKYANLRVLRRAADAGGGKSGALNDVWPLTEGDIIAVFDADAQVPNDLLMRVIPLFEQERVGAVQVRKETVNASENIWTRNQSIEMILDSHLQQQRIAMGGIGELRGNGQFIRRAALKQCQGWNEQTITDDLDMTLRLHLNQWKIDFLFVPSVGEEGVTTAIALWHQRNRWAEGGYQRYLDYWRLLVQNRLGIRKTYDLLMFCLMQYIFPTAALPDLLMSVIRSRLPIFTPVTSVTLLFSFTSMIVGIRRMNRRRVIAQVATAQGETLSYPRQQDLASFDGDRSNRSRPSLLRGFRDVAWPVLHALQGTIYMLHWLPVIASTTLRISIRPKQLKWVKTVHRGKGDDFSTNEP